MFLWFLPGLADKRMPMQHQRVWILGASSGLGAALAKGLASEGAKLAISARSQEGLAQCLGEMQGDEHLALPLDVTDMPSMQRAATKLREHWGGIDYVIYCVGDYTPPQWEPFCAAPQLNMLDVNLGGVFRLLEVMMPWWRDEGRGRLVLVSSITALGGAPHSLAYGASKAGLSHLAESLCIDLARYNIQVQLATPGFMDTPMLAKIPRKKTMVMDPAKAAWKLRLKLGTPRFEIIFPRSFTLMAKLTRWLLPRSWYMTLTRWAGN